MLLESCNYFILLSKSLIASLHVEMNEQEEDVDQSARNASKNTTTAPATKPDVQEAVANAEEPERSDSDESDDSM